MYESDKQRPSQNIHPDDHLQTDTDISRPLSEKGPHRKNKTKIELLAEKRLLQMQLHMARTSYLDQNQNFRSSYQDYK